MRKSVKSGLICLLLAVLCIFSVLTVGAEPLDSPDYPGYEEYDPEYTPEEYPEYTPEEYPEEDPEYTPEENPEYIPEETYENTDEVYDATETVTASDSSSAEETTGAPVETRPEPSYRAPLPTLSEEIEIPEAIGSSIEENEPEMFWGFVCWICIGVGIAAILAVLLSTKTRAYRAGGKKRYSSGDKISGKQRLLNDKYYNNHKRR